MAECNTDAGRDNVGGARRVPRGVPDCIGVASRIALPSEKDGPELSPFSFHPNAEELRYAGDS